MKPAVLLLSFLALSAACAPAQTSSPHPHSPPAAESFQPPATVQHPALFLVGDSIVRTGTGNGERGPWGWGYEIIPMFDMAKIHVYNQGLGGRSSRGYREEGA